VVTETYGMLHALAKKNLMKPRLLAGISSAIGIIICGTNFSENRRFGENALKLQTIILVAYDVTYMHVTVWLEIFRGLKILRFSRINHKPRKCYPRKFYPRTVLLVSTWSTFSRS